MNTINIGLIQTELKSHPEYQEPLTILAQKKRGRFMTTFRRLKRQLDVKSKRDWTKEDVARFMKMMQDAGAGKVVLGQGTPKILWDFHLKSVACAALGVPQTDRNGNPIDDIKLASRQRKVLPKLPSVATPVVQHRPIAMAPTHQVIKLRRSDVEIELDLGELTPEGCRKITDLILSIDRS